jgi:DNA-binding response OmpR family regulator
MHPDVVTLNVEMPVMNGLETLAELRRLYPKLPVIMFSTLTERGAAATLDALSLGASDYATKPSNTGSPAVAMEAVRVNLSSPFRFCNLLIPQTGRKCQKAYTSLSIVQLSYNLLVERSATNREKFPWRGVENTAVRHFHSLQQLKIEA